MISHLPDISAEVKKDLPPTNTDCGTTVSTALWNEAGHRGHLCPVTWARTGVQVMVGGDGVLSVGAPSHLCPTSCAGPARAERGSQALRRSLPLLLMTCAVALMSYMYTHMPHTCTMCMLCDTHTHALQHSMGRPRRKDTSVLGGTYE